MVMGIEKLREKHFKFLLIMFFIGLFAFVISLNLYIDEFNKNIEVQVISNNWTCEKGILGQYVRCSPPEDHIEFIIENFSRIGEIYIK